MTTPAFILFPGPDRWRIGVASGATRAAPPIDVPIGSGADAVAIATAIAGALARVGYRGQGVLLALASDACLCAAVKITGLPEKSRRQAMAYRLEEKLPVAVEEVVADFIPQDADGNQTLGACTQKTPLAAAVQALEAAGIPIAAICPAALVALQSVLADPKLNDLDAIVWPTDLGHRLELFTLEHGRPQGWSIVAASPAELLLHLRLELNGRQSPMRVAGELPSGLGAALSSDRGFRWTPVEIDPIAAATALAAPILAGKIAPWIDLRRDDLAIGGALRRLRAPLISVAVSMSIAMLILCAAMLWRAGRYNAAASQLADQMQSGFRQAFPGMAIPPDVHSRLQAEERNLRGLSGDTEAAPPPPQAGLLTLRQLITNLPAEDQLRYRVLELRLDGDRFTLEGQATAHGDADAIVAALRRGGAFTVEPPRTEQLTSSTGDAAKGVSFTLTGRAAR